MVAWLVLLSVLATCLAETGSDVNNLLTSISATYNKKVRPVIDQGVALNVAVDFNLNSVIDFDEKTESLKTAGYLDVHWNDQYFKWTPIDFNNTQHVLVPQDDIWKPDLSLRNTYKSFTGLGSSYLNVFIDNNGSVTWTPFQVLESTCSVSITYFPFDVQKCELKFIAWSYTKAEVEINKGSRGIILDNYVPSASWTILETSAEEINTDEAAVVFKITLKRKPRFFVINILIPVILLSILNVFCFMLPVASGERAGYSITVFLSLAVFLTIVSDQLPNNSENTSILAVYLMLISSLSTGIVMLCLIQLRLYSWNDTKKPVNKLCRMFVKFGNCLQLRVCRKPGCSKRSETPVEKISSKVDLKDEKDDDEEENVKWVDVVDAMDYIFFFISILYTFICTLVVGAVSVHVPQV